MTVYDLSGNGIVPNVGELPEGWDQEDIEEIAQNSGGVVGLLVADGVTDDAAAIAALPAGQYSLQGRTVYINSHGIISTDNLHITGPGKLLRGPNGRLTFTGTHQSLSGLEHEGTLSSETQFAVVVDDATPYFASPTYDGGDGVANDGSDFVDTISGSKLTITSTIAGVRRVVSSVITLDPDKRYVVDWLPGYEISGDGMIAPAFIAKDGSDVVLASNGTTLAANGRYHPGGQEGAVGTWMYLTGCTNLYVALGVSRASAMQASVTAIYNLSHLRVWELTEDLATISNASWPQDTGFIWATGSDFACFGNTVKFMDRCFFKDVGAERTQFYRNVGRFNLCALATYQSCIGFQAWENNDDGRFLDDVGELVPNLAMRTGSIVGAGGVEGTATGGTAAAPTLSSGFSAVNDTYNGLPFYVLGGETAIITDYVGSTKTPTLKPALGAALANGTVVYIGGTKGCKLNRNISRGKLWPFEDTGWADTDYIGNEAYQCHSGISCGGQGFIKSNTVEMLTYGSLGIELTRNAHHRRVTHNSISQRDIGPFCKGIISTHRMENSVISHNDIRANGGIYVANASTAARNNNFDNNRIDYATFAFHSKSSGRVTNLTFRPVAHCHGWQVTSIPAAIVAEATFDPLLLSGIRGKGHTCLMAYFSSVQVLVMSDWDVEGVGTNAEIQFIPLGAAPSDWRLFNPSLRTGLANPLLASTDLFAGSVVKLNNAVRRDGSAITAITNVNASFIVAKSLA